MIYNARYKKLSRNMNFVFSVFVTIIVFESIIIYFMVVYKFINNGVNANHIGNKRSKRQHSLRTI